MEVVGTCNSGMMRETQFEFCSKVVGFGGGGGENSQEGKGKCSKRLRRPRDRLNPGTLTMSDLLFSTSVLFIFYLFLLWNSHIYIHYLYISTIYLLNSSSLCCQNRKLLADKYGTQYLLHILVHNI